MNVEEVFLLSVEEWNNIVSSVPNIPVELDNFWWLRSPGHTDYCAAYVGGIGYVDFFGRRVDLEFGVRPAFRISHLSGFKPGDKITVSTKTVCTVICNDTALADSIVCKHRFDPKSNNYNNSEIKAYINFDEFKNML